MGDYLAAERMDEEVAKKMKNNDALDVSYFVTARIVEITKDEWETVHKKPYTLSGDPTKFVYGVGYKKGYNDVGYPVPNTGDGIRHEDAEKIAKALNDTLPQPCGDAVKEKTCIDCPEWMGQKDCCGWKDEPALTQPKCPVCFDSDTVLIHRGTWDAMGQPPKAGDRSKLWYAYELLKPLLVRREYFADSDTGLMACVNVHNAFNQVEQYLRHNETPKADVDLMARVYEEERAEYLGGTVYYANNHEAFKGCMNKALAAQGYIGVPEGWQDIDTAPKDKFAVFMVCSKESYPPYVVVNAAKDCPMKEKYPWRTYLGGKFIGGNPWGDWVNAEKITHWMPLPAAPKKEG